MVEEEEEEEVNAISRVVYAVCELGA